MLLTKIDGGSENGPVSWAPTANEPARWLASDEHDHIVNIARNMFRCPSAAIVFDEPDAEEDLDDASFSRWAARSAGPLVVVDALADPRFCQNMMVRAYPHIRFYVGTQIVLASGAVVGTLSVMDYVIRDTPRHSEITALTSLASLAGNYMEETFLQLGRPAQAAQFDFLVDRALTGVLTIGTDGRVVNANRAAERLLRTEHDRLVGAPADEHIMGWRMLADDYRNGVGAFEESEPPLRTILVEVVTRDGFVVPSLASLSCWLVGGRPVFRLIIDELP